MTIPSGVTTVGNNAFDGAAALASINLGPTTTTLGNGVFKDCALLKEVVFTESVTSMGNNLFENCTSLSNLVFPRAMVSIEGTEILVGATALRSLKMHKDLWTSAVQPSLVENVSGFAQLVEFYGNADVLNLLTTKGYQDILDYYALSKNSYTVDWSTGGSDLVKNGSSGLIYNGSLLSTGVGTFDGVLTITGTGELTPSLVEAGIRAHTFAQNELRPLHTLIVGPDFTSLNSLLSLADTGITSLHFPMTNSITTTGKYVLSIDSSLVVLPQWIL
jgi:hypothetical protein